MQLRDGEFTLMQQMITHLCGVVLDDTKGYLVETRLGRIARNAGCENFNELYAKLRHGRDQKLLDKVTDAITTHETTWFRDGGPYDILENRLLPDLINARLRAGQKRLRIWSAACSTGQEPYSVGMILHEILPDLPSWDIEITASDISVGTVEKARKGVFSNLEMGRTARPAYMRKFFRPEGDGHRVIESVRKLVKFEERNLLMPFSMLGPFDLVFLRNVLIYFDNETRNSIVRRAAQIMVPRAYMISGGSENLSDIGPEFLPEMVSGVPVYQPNRALLPK